MPTFPNYINSGFTGEIHTILKCFVDINLKTDENETWSNELLSVSFDEDDYFGDEGETINVSVSLSQPSVLGIEEIDIYPELNTIKNFSLNAIATQDDFIFSGVTTISPTNPLRLSWSAGEQTKIFPVEFNEDLFDEETESFRLILNNNVNVNDGPFMETLVSIGDTTELKEVSILLTNGVVSTQFGMPILEYNFREGDLLEVVVSLDSPSVIGLETVGLEISHITTDNGDIFPGGGVVNLAWNIGDQVKTIPINAFKDINIEGVESFTVALVNPFAVNIVNNQSTLFATAQANVFEEFDIQFAQVNFQNFYVQKGAGNSTIDLRYNIDGNNSINFNETWDYMIKFGVPTTQQFSVSSQAQPGSNTTDSPFGGAPHTLFFGENPHLNATQTGEFLSTSTNQTPGDLRVKITSAGVQTVNFSGATLFPGDDITFIVDRNDFSLNLPANNNLIAAGFLNPADGALLSADTYTVADYQIEFEVDYSELNFTLRAPSNNVATGVTFDIGVQSFLTHPKTNSILPQNHYNLVSSYENVFAYYENQVTPPFNLAPHCLAGLLGNAEPFPNNLSTDLINARIDGVMFLNSPSSLNSNSSVYSTIEFLSGATANITCNSKVVKPGTFTSSLPRYGTIAFELLP